jgi:hypothetical protein
MEDQHLACLHYDLLCLVFSSELALSANQMLVRREAAAGRNAHAAARAAESVAAATPKPSGECA